MASKAICLVLRLYKGNQYMEHSVYVDDDPLRMSNDEIVKMWKEKPRYTNVELARVVS